MIQLGLKSLAFFFLLLMPEKIIFNENSHVKFLIKIVCRTRLILVYYRNYLNLMSKLTNLPIKRQL